MQLPAVANSNDMIAAVAFYVKFPPGVAIGVTDTLDKSLLVDIVNGSLARIGRAINKTLLSVSVYMVDKPTIKPTIIEPTDYTTKVPEMTRENQAYHIYLIIGGSVAGGILIIIAAALIIR
jgi:hypothetical protein